MPVLYGEQNINLKKIEQALSVQLDGRGNELTITGSPANTEKAHQVLDALWDKLRAGQELDSQLVDAALRFQQEANGSATEQNGIKGFSDSETFIVTRKRRIVPRTPLQAEYMEAMKRSNLVFGIGPAGTGKTYLAVAMAASMLEAGKIERIILSRPAVEAGERLGFLPGEMREKMDPYMRPLYDALYDTMGGEKVQKKIATEEIEIAPLAFMRGRTLNNAFIILDEAQNTSTMQMLMFLTRAGENSRVVVTGDPSQTDLPGDTRSGLLDAVETLKGVDGMDFIHFSRKDVIRSRLVAKIIEAYEARKTENRRDG